MQGEALKGHLDMLVLAAVEPEPVHGYAVIETLRSRSGEVFDLPEGTVYPALHRLERRQLLASRWSTHAGRRRRIYRITPKGRAALREQADLWQTFHRAVRGVLRGTEALA